MEQYSSVDGISTASYPSDWYAFSSGNVRFYILDGSWTDANVGTAAGLGLPVHRRQQQLQDVPG